MGAQREVFMSRQPPIWPGPASYLKCVAPEEPVLFFAPQVLQAQARAFLAGFDGLVTYALKANDAPEVVENLWEAGIRGFDVASPAEISLVRALRPQAALHYNNPVRSPGEIAAARAAGVGSWSVDGAGELRKLMAADLPRGTEVSVRLRLPVAGAAYDFGEKFGEDPDAAVGLLRAVARAGFNPAMTFHPGTQCTEPGAWRAYIEACAGVARAAGVGLARLNVGGGFAADRDGKAPDLEAVFRGISQAVARAFGPGAPALVCEPGRALVAESHVLATRVKALRACGAVFLNDGIYGTLGEALTALGVVGRIRVLAPDGRPRQGPRLARTVYGPTCDSLDRLPGTVALPADTAEGDYVLFENMGAYSTATATRFNGYGRTRVITVRMLAL